MVVAFEGWNDAGEAATAAVRYLGEQWAAHPFARIEPEDFYDFTVTRPQVRIVEGEQRVLEWPENRFFHARPVGAPDLVLLTGVEPQLKWKTFCAQIIEVASVLRVRLVLSLGALLADVPHTRPTSVFGTAYDPKVIEALHLEPSRYEGPTGIVGVLHQELRERGINSASLWAAVPSYVSGVPSPKAAQALVEKVGAMLSAPVPLTDLDAASLEYVEQIDRLVSEDDDTIDYVRHLEELHDGDGAFDPLQGSPLDGERARELVAEVERFLREQ